MSRFGRHGVFVRMFSSAVVNQAVLSAASLMVSLVLIRHTSDHEYGYYVLVVAAMLLLTSLQNAFYAPSMIVRMTRFDRAQRSDLVGGLYREQRTVWTCAAVAAVGAAAALWAFGIFNGTTGPIVITGIVVALAVLRREYFRTVLLAYRRAEDVLKADVPYVVLLVAGAAVATLSPAPAMTAVLGLGLSALIGGALLARALRRHEHWDIRGAPGILREIAPLAVWSTAGAVVHWSFSQGYSYLVAGTLDITAVAAIGATRLLMMPINLLSTGIGSLMLPLASSWLHQHGAGTVLRRLSLFAAGLAAATLCYFVLMWLVRDWLFATVLRKQFADRDRLLLLWGAISLVTVIRDQLIYLPVSRERFRPLTAQALVSAIAALIVSYWGMRFYGVWGALIGVLTGELLNVAGLVVLSLLEVKSDRAALRASTGNPAL